MGKDRTDGPVPAVLGRTAVRSQSRTGPGPMPVRTGPEPVLDRSNRGGPLETSRHQRELNSGPHKKAIATRVLYQLSQQDITKLPVKGTLIGQLLDKIRSDQM